MRFARPALRHPSYAASGEVERLPAVQPLGSVHLRSVHASHNGSNGAGPADADYAVTCDYFGPSHPLMPMSVQVH